MKADAPRTWSAADGVLYAETVAALIGKNINIFKKTAHDDKYCIIGISQIGPVEA